MMRIIVIDIIIMILMYTAWTSLHISSIARSLSLLKYSPDDEDHDDVYKCITATCLDFDGMITFPGGLFVPLLLGVWCLSSNE